MYLAQRLLVSHKLYHRRCFRCSKCSGHISPKNFDIVEGSEFTCDSCKNEKTLSKYLNNNDHDQMGMLAFTDNVCDTQSVTNEESASPKYKPRPKSILGECIVLLIICKIHLASCKEVSLFYEKTFVLQCTFKYCLQRNVKCTW